MIRRGEIYWVEFDPVKGSEQGGLRPALVVQNDIGNRFSATTVVVAITRTIPSQPYPFLVVVEPQESGLPVRSLQHCAQIATIHQSGATSRLRPPRGKQNVEPIGQLDETIMRKIDLALKYNLGIE